MAEDGAPGGAKEKLERLRRRIVELDEELIGLVGERRDLVLEIGRLKREMGLPVLDPGREAEVVRRAAEIARKLGVDEELTRDVVWRIMASAREAQEGERGWGPPDYPVPDAGSAVGDGEEKTGEDAPPAGGA